MNWFNVARFPTIFLLTVSQLLSCEDRNLLMYLTCIRLKSHHYMYWFTDTMSNLNGTEQNKQSH